MLQLRRLLNLTQNISISTGLTLVQLVVSIELVKLILSTPRNTPNPYVYNALWLSTALHAQCACPLAKPIDLQWTDRIESAQPRTPEQQSLPEQIQDPSCRIPCHTSKFSAWCKIGRPSIPILKRTCAALSFVTDRRRSALYQTLK